MGGAFGLGLSGDVAKEDTNVLWNGMEKDPNKARPPILQSWLDRRAARGQQLSGAYSRNALAMQRRLYCGDVMHAGKKRLLQPIYALSISLTCIR